MTSDTVTISEAAAYTSVPRAAAMLGVKPTTMHELIDSGRIPCIVPHKQRRVKVEDVIQYRDRVSQRGRGKRLTLSEDLLAD